MSVVSDVTNPLTGALGCGCGLRPAEGRHRGAGFTDLLRSADLVVTGEGSLDEQTLHGKAPTGVADAARAAGVPVVAVCGRSTLGETALHAAGISKTYRLTDLEPDVSRCISDAAALLEVLGEQIATTHLAPQDSPDESSTTPRRSLREPHLRPGDPRQAGCAPRRRT